MEDGDGVSYETLQDLLRQERRSNKLIPVRNGFWSDLQDFLKDAEGEFREEQAKDPWNRKAMMLSDRVKNARHAAETVWSLRERKLAMLALAHAADGGHPEGLTKKELVLYERLLETLRQGREVVFEGTAAAPRPPKPAPAVPGAQPETAAPAGTGDATEADDGEAGPRVPEPAPVPAPAETDGVASAEGDGESADGPSEKPTDRPGPGARDPAGDDEAPEPPARDPAPEPAPTPAQVPPDTPDDGIVTIRALGDIPPFVGPDMDTYRLKEGDLASVPENIANLLVKRGKAAVVQAS